MMGRQRGTGVALVISYCLNLMRRIFFSLYILNNEVNIIGKPLLGVTRPRSVPQQLRDPQPRIRYPPFDSDSVLISVLQPTANQTQTYRYTLASVLPSSPSVAVGNSFPIQPFKNSRCLPSFPTPTTLLPAKSHPQSSSSPSPTPHHAGPRCASTSGPPPLVRCSSATSEPGTSMS